jgi:hypothetical protein
MIHQKCRGLCSARRLGQLPAAVYALDAALQQGAAIVPLEDPTRLTELAAASTSRRHGHPGPRRVLNHRPDAAPWAVVIANLEVGRLQNQRRRPLGDLFQHGAIVREPHSAGEALDGARHASVNLIGSELSLDGARLRKVDDQVGDRGAVLAEVDVPAVVVGTGRCAPGPALQRVGMDRQLSHRPTLRRPEAPATRQVARSAKTADRSVMYRWTVTLTSLQRGTNKLKITTEGPHPDEAAKDALDQLAQADPLHGVTRLELVVEARP